MSKFFFKHSLCIKLIQKGMQSFFKSQHSIVTKSLAVIMEKMCKVRKDKKTNKVMVMASVSLLKFYMWRSSTLYIQHSSSWTGGSAILLCSWVAKYRHKYSSEIHATVDFSELLRHLVQHLVQLVSWLFCKLSLVFGIWGNAENIIMSRQFWAYWPNPLNSV